MKKGLVIAVLLILLVLGIVFAQEPTEEEVVVVGTDTPESTECGTCTTQNNIFTQAGSRLKAFGGWLITRDYKAVILNAWNWLAGLGIGLKIVIALVFLIFLLIIWNYNFRNTRANNLKKARRYHLKGEKAHRQGDDEMAKEHYERAREYREKAQDQW